MSPHGGDMDGGEKRKERDGGPAGTSILERIYEGVNVYYNYTGEAKCFELDDDPHGMSGWEWQVCKS